MKTYIISRVTVYLLVIFIGISLCFVIPRLTGADPVEVVLERIGAYEDYYDPVVIEGLRNSLEELYGLKGSILEQYISFWKRLLLGDFGPSLTEFPTPVTKLVYRAMPWTLGLLLVTTLVSWSLSNLVGGIAGYFEKAKWAKPLTAFSIVVRNIPYYILSLCLVFFFSYLIPIFPMMGGYSIGVKPSLSLEFILDVLHHAFLPAVSIVIGNYGAGFIVMRGLSTAVKSEDYTKFAEIMRLDRRTILYRYIIRNALLPRVTALAISLGNIFTGALALEVVFSYPGLGSLLQRAIINSDYNLIMGITTYSIVGVATATLLLDFIYPFVDPRIRYK